jgi:hypothetical protein
MYLMIGTFEERWNVEYLSGVTNKVVELVCNPYPVYTYEKEPKFRNLPAREGETTVFSACTVQHDCVELAQGLK